MGFLLCRWKLPHISRHAAALRVGDGLSDGTQMGPLANDRRLGAMADFIRDAAEKGAEIVAGGDRIGDVGNFWAPTVLANVPLDAKVFNDEPFGPIAAIRPFNDIEEAISEANRLSFGLAGYGFTRSLKNADLLARKVEGGMMWINMPASTSPELPFGGLKDSGYGSEAGPEAQEAYLNVRSVAVLNA
ncbi:NAD-dependent succinate-semialdehyde dehydrogenase [Cupriavidus necator]|uniref:NAD-dependent succinate-semialdehyde dehydrogenase n=1 Tax=Cupriavidus necator TaxID=106590 RepID=A0A2P1DUY1_CUPNE|nr:NAD-dependent succinate-semialdehyde dehydrogenase [Cupriavidus necator]